VAAATTTAVATVTAVMVGASNSVCLTGVIFVSLGKVELDLTLFFEPLFLGGHLTKNVGIWYTVGSAKRSLLFDGYHIGVGTK
jgi:hypothetical protein